MKIKLFASLIKISGKTEIEIRLPHEGSTVKDLLSELENNYRGLAEIIRSRRAIFVVNQETITNPDHRINEGDEVALLPPFSGGAGDNWVKIQKENFSVENEIKKIKTASLRIGGIVTFIGTARDFSNEKKILKMEFEYYPGMAEKKLAEIRKQALKDFKIIEVGIIHRTGGIAVGENIVLIIVAAEHRAEAFKACNWCIDELKRITPIWKKEITTEGENWIQ